MIDILTRCLPLVAPALRYADNPVRPLWRVDLLAYTIFVWLVDMVLAHIYFSPQKNEWTISHTLERTAPKSIKHWQFAEAINAISPGHIKAVV